LSESLEQTIFRLIQSKDEKGILDLLNSGVATKKMVDQERKSYQRIYETHQLNQVLILLPNYAVLNLLTVKNSCKIRVFVGLEKDNQGKPKIDKKGNDFPLYEETIWNLEKMTLAEQEQETRSAINSWLKRRIEQ
jgi:hypothetical protein